jgi:hypothetical protein
MTQSRKSQDLTAPDNATDMQRRKFLKTSAAAGALTISGAPFIRNAVGRCRDNHLEDSDLLARRY